MGAQAGEAIVNTRALGLGWSKVHLIATDKGIIS